MTEFSDDDLEDLAREVYSQAGLALFCANVLEQEIIHFVYLSKRADRSHKVTHRSFDDYYDEQTKKTLGALLKDVQGRVTFSYLEEVLERRNFLVHQFFRERAVHFMSPNGQLLMIQELATMVAMFRTTNDQFIQLTASMGAPLGLTSRSIEAAKDEMTKPLPLLPP